MSCNRSPDIRPVTQLKIRERTRRRKGSRRRVFQPGDQVEAFVELHEQARNLRRIILEVRVDRDDDLAAGLAETGRQRSCLAEISTQAHDAHVLVGVMQPRQCREGPVHGAVVDKDGFPLLPQWFEGSLELVVEEGDRALLVVQRDDD